MSAALDEDPRVGSVLQGRYLIISRLAAGGMGVVYKGERVHLKRPVAIKFLHPTFAAQESIVKRFETEAMAMSRLGHPHCVSVIDFGVDAGAPYVVMDFVHGTNLRELIDAGPVPQARAIAIVRQLLAALAHAHGQGIVHRDIKPANIMLSEATGTGDHVRVLDFGLAKLRDGAVSADQSMASMAVGTPSYMSPEQGRGEAVDARTDVYSVGIVLHELLTGQKPFLADQAWEILKMHSEAKPPRLGEAAPDREFPPALEDVVLQAMSKKKEDRFQSAAEFLTSLDEAVEGTEAAPARLRTAPLVGPRKGSAEKRKSGTTRVSPEPRKTPAEPRKTAEPRKATAKPRGTPAEGREAAAEPRKPAKARTTPAEPHKAATNGESISLSRKDMAEVDPSIPSDGKTIHIPGPLDESSVPLTEGQRRGGRGGTLFVLVMLALAVGGGWWWWTNKGPGAERPEPPPPKQVEILVPHLTPAVPSPPILAPILVPAPAAADAGAVAVVPVLGPDAGAVGLVPAAPAVDPALAVPIPPVPGMTTGALGSPDAGAVEAAGSDAGMALPADEQPDPIPAVTVEHVEEAQVDPGPTAAPAPAPPAAVEVKTVADVEKLLRAGKKGEAVTGLEKLQRANPKSAYIPYLLGNLYFERMWWTDGMQRYRAAIANNREYRKRSVLIKNTIRALGSNKTSAKAYTLLSSVIGAPALPYLRSAAKSDGNSKVRARAASLVKKISKRR